MCVAQWRLCQLAGWIDDFGTLVQQRIDAESIQLEGVRSHFPTAH
jgi:hypothetical protein